jgi:hypothetical protein
MSMQAIIDTAKAREYFVEQLAEGTSLARLGLRSGAKEGTEEEAG